MDLSYMNDLKWLDEALKKDIETMIDYYEHVTEERHKDALTQNINGPIAGCYHINMMSNMITTMLNKLGHYSKKLCLKESKPHLAIKIFNESLVPVKERLAEWEKELNTLSQCDKDL